MLSNIKAEMSRNKATNIIMAKVVGISETSFSFKLNEKREFTLNELAAMSQYFNCSIDYLVAIRDTGQPNQAS